jgi:hypothetical protein
VILLKADFYLYPPRRPALRPTHHIILNIEGHLPGVKRRENDRSPEFSAEVINEWSYTSVPTNTFIKSCLINNTDYVYLISYLQTAFTVPLANF